MNNNLNTNFLFFIVICVRCESLRLKNGEYNVHYDNLATLAEREGAIS